MQETQVQFLGQEDLLEKEMATHTRVSCLENSMEKVPWWATVSLWGHKEFNTTERLTYVLLCLLMPSFLTLDS